MLRRTVTAAVLFAAISLPYPAGADAAAPAEIAALEARVAELEALVMQLVDKSAPASAATPPAATETHTYRFGGYIKLDGLFSDYSGGNPAPSSIGTQLYVPLSIPVGGAPSEGPDFNMQARETRINFRSDHVLANDDRFGTFVEMDFFLGTGGNQRVTNSYNPRLRHAYVTYNNWLAGQSWSTFQDAEALPENLDFIGPSEGTTFERQAQLRYALGAWEFAAENPETTLTPFGGGAQIESDDGGIPDLVARYTSRFNNGYIKAAGLLRQLVYKENGVDDSATAFGLSLSGKHRFGEDDIRWMATVGSGTGRYLGLNTSNGAVLGADGDLNAIDQWGGFVSWRHFWDSRWRSNFTLGYLSNDNDVALTGTEVTRDVYSVHANLLFEPAENMTVGGEILFAERTLESDLSGDLTRLLVSAKYAF